MTIDLVHEWLNDNKQKITIESPLGVMQLDNAILLTRDDCLLIKATPIRI